MNGKLICNRCGVVDLPYLSFSGPHIKASCAHCRRYIEFISPSKVLDPKEIKQMIWAKTKDLSLIETKKKEIGLFHENMNKKESQVAYYRLYHML